MTSMEISSSSGLGSSSGSTSGSESGSRSSKGVSTSGCSGSPPVVGTVIQDDSLGTSTSASATSAKKIQDDATSGGNGGDAPQEGAVQMVIENVAADDERPEDYDSGNEAVDGSDVEVFYLGLTVVVERHLCPIKNAIGNEQFFSDLALKELSIYFPDPLVYSLRGATHVMRRRPGMVMVHFDSIRAGLRFPHHPFYIEFFSCFQVAPAQFIPNSYRFISSFLVRCKAVGVTATLELFHYFFRLTPQNSDGFLSIAARLKRKLFEGASDVHQ
ncbi:unnamed protein product [Cuscuta epithymum]|uniref:Transposase (putative) gypsy type domain-containing protein n=1 Tax=Cuscuta epithymum TaxID=186058 RepID=A0AAV0FML1_9ASTE|nr:unnamed protein product [Cuscuta epithymum]